MPSMNVTIDNVFREELLCEKLRVVFRHWNSARGAQAMPARRSIDPLEMHQALPRLWIYEREDDGLFRCRIAGEEINAAYGRPIQGRLAREVIGPKFDEVVGPRFHYVLNNAAFYHGYSVESPSGQTIERICLPLADKDGVPRFVFGASQYFDSSAPKLYQDSYVFISLDVTFYRVGDLARISEGTPA